MLLTLKNKSISPAAGAPSQYPEFIPMSDFKASRETAQEAPYAPLYTVSDLTRAIKDHLEAEFSLVWVSGEVSNLRLPHSGHCYFTLKDENCQLRIVMFRSSLQNLRFRLADSLKIICRGQITVYEPRGEYQLIADYAEPLGLGALALAFEELKKRLAAEGLFDERHKKPLPFLPRRLAVITSPSGAAIRDFLQIIHRRFPKMAILIYPVRVQGAGAAEEIVAALDTLNQRDDLDVLILTRGGGSLEDLWAFNEEKVARAIFRSRIPVIAAIGHEIDYTIADFVADVRAPTPSAAAMLVVRRQEELQDRLRQAAAGLRQRLLTLIGQRRERLALLSQRLPDPRRRLIDLRLRLDDRLEKLYRLWRQRQAEAVHQLKLAIARLNLLSIRRQTEVYRHRLKELQPRLLRSLVQEVNRRRRHLEHLQPRLEHLNPEAVLARGYAIALTLPERQVLHRAAQVRPGQRLAIYLHQGSLECTVNKIKNEKLIRIADEQDSQF